MSSDEIFVMADAGQRFMGVTFEMPHPKLNARAYVDLTAYCHRVGIAPPHSPFHEKSAAMGDDTQMERFKHGSHDLSKLPLPGHVTANEQASFTPH